MLKLLLILAAAAAIAAAAHSAPLEFHHLEDSDTDLLLADVADELDLNDDLGRNDEVDERADDPESDSETDDELLSVDEIESSDEAEIRPIPIGLRDEDGVLLSCPLTYIKRGLECEKCPDQKTTSYGEQDGNACSSCEPNYELDKSTGICNNQELRTQTFAQTGVVLGLEDIGIEQVTIKQKRFPASIQKVTVTDFSTLKNDVKVLYSLTTPQARQVARTVQSGLKNNAIGNDVTMQLENTLQTAQQTKSCGSGKVCCLQGWYGDHPNCVQCPSSAPSSPRTASGGPDSNCNCPNAAASSCFACSNPICRPFNPATGICTPVCPSCRVQMVNNKLVPKCS